MACGAALYRAPRFCCSGVERSAGLNPYSGAGKCRRPTDGRAWRGVHALLGDGAIALVRPVCSVRVLKVLAVEPGLDAACPIRASSVWSGWHVVGRTGDAVDRACRSLPRPTRCKRHESRTVPVRLEQRGGFGALVDPEAARPVWRPAEYQSPIHPLNILDTICIRWYYIYVINVGGRHCPRAPHHGRNAREALSPRRGPGRPEMM